jgi:hypothetical protein
MSTVLVTIIIIGVVVIALAVGTAVARRRGYSGIGGDTVVRCSKGHLFTTIWLPGVSLKSVRLGMSRYQHCPVGHHWAVVTPVKDSELTDDDRRLAAGQHDVRIP